VLKKFRISKYSYGLAGKLEGLINRLNL